MLASFCFVYTLWPGRIGISASTRFTHVIQNSAVAELRAKKSSKKAKARGDMSVVLLA